MKRRFLSVVLAFVTAVAFLLSGTASATSLEGKLNSSSGSSPAATNTYGTVYALNQPLIMDWSPYAAYGSVFTVTIFNLKTLEIEDYNEKIPYVWSVYRNLPKGSHGIYVEVFDGNGNPTKDVMDFFHIGAVTVKPEFIPQEKVPMKGVLAKDSKKYPAYSDKYWEASSAIIGANPYFDNLNNNYSALWINEGLNGIWIADVINVVRKGYASSKYSYNYGLEAKLFVLINQYRALNGKAALAWNDQLGNFARLRATAAGDNAYNNNGRDLSELGNTEGPADGLRRYGFIPSESGLEWFWYNEGKINWDRDETAFEIFDEMLAEPELRADMLGDYTFGAIGAVKCNRILGTKQPGIAYMIEFQN